jgi:hypothetical protein
MPGTTISSKRPRGKMFTLSLKALRSSLVGTHSQVSSSPTSLLQGVFVDELCKGSSPTVDLLLMNHGSDALPRQSSPSPSDASSLTHVSDESEPFGIVAAQVDNAIHNEVPDERAKSPSENSIFSDHQEIPGITVIDPDDAPIPGPSTSPPPTRAISPLDTRALTTGLVNIDEHWSCTETCKCQLKKLLVSLGLVASGSTIRDVDALKLIVAGFLPSDDTLDRAIELKGQDALLLQDLLSFVRSRYPLLTGSDEWVDKWA